MPEETATAQPPEGTTDTGQGGEPQNPEQAQQPQEGAAATGGESEGGKTSLAEMLPDNLKQDETLQGYESLEQMAEDLKSLKGQQSQGPPEQYELDAQVPEDAPQELKDAAEQDTEKFKEVARELGLSNDAAQRLLQFDAERQANMAETLQQHADAQINQELESYKQERGDAFTDDVNNARAFMQAFADEGVRSWMDETGLGNHPKLISMLAQAGKMLQEHEVIQGAKSVPGSTGSSIADRLYSAPPINKQEGSE